MSSSGSHTPEHTPSNEDDVNMKKIVGVGVISLVIFALSAVVAFFILKVDTANLQAATGVVRKGKYVGHPEIGIVDAVPFDEDKRLGEWRDKLRNHLNGYGWVDRSKGIIHIPIDQAMDAVIKKAGGGQK
jgi:hypothetical protein